ncbi:MAG: pilin [Patescibacteria group bacterium]|nr:pilin [Patescibacteria group bacterium]MCL5093711.1 pilin [Patescibacteria group bacterium]
MKKKITGITLALMSLIPGAALAVNSDEIKPTPMPINSNINIAKLITNIINYILGFSAALAVLFIIYGGIIYMTSSGDEKRTANAKKILFSAIIGLVILILALVIVNFVTTTTQNALVGTNP